MRRLARYWPGLLVGLGALHLLAAWWLEPGWLFTKYPDAAGLVARGELPTSAAADFSPAYLFLNTVIAPQWLRWLQALVGVGAVVTVASLGRRVGGPLGGLVAGLVAAVHPTLLAYEATLEPDLFLAALHLVGFRLLVELRDAHRLTLGLAVLGLAAALRPTEWLFVGAALLGVASWVWRRRAFGALGLGLAAAVTLGVAPALWQRTLGAQTSSTMSLGPSLYVGQRPEQNGLGSSAPSALKAWELQYLSSNRPDYAHELFRQVARLATGATSGPAVERYWLDLAFSFARRHPGAFVHNLTRKVRGFFAGPVSHDIGDVRLLEERARGVTHLDPSLVSLLALMGLVATRFRNRRWVWLVLAAVVMRLSLALTFVVMGRYQLPLLVLELFALASLVRPRRRAGVRELAAVGLGGLLLLAWFDFHAITQPLFDAGTKGRAALRAFTQARQAGDENAARAAWAEAVGAQPFLLETSDLVGFQLDPAMAHAAGARRAAMDADAPLDRLLLAKLAVAAGECAAVASELPALEDTSWSVYDYPLAAWPLEVRCALEANAPEQANAAVRSARASRPGALFVLAHTLVSEGSAEVEAELAELHDPVSAAWAVTQTAVERGDATLALRWSERLVTLMPDAGIAWAWRARALLLSAQRAPALEALSRAAQLAPTQVFDVQAFEPLFDAQLQGEATAEQWSLGGEVAWRAGHWALARARWAEAEQRWGGSAPAWHTRWKSRLTRP